MLSLFSDLGARRTRRAFGSPLLTRMGPPPVLRKRHTLEGKNILPIIKKMRSHEGGGPVTMARLRMNETIEQLTEDELRSNFKRLTGDTAREILEMAGKEDTRDNVEVLLHYTILHANEIGQPSGQDLSEAVEEHIEPPPKKRCSSDTSMLEKRVKELEEQQKQEKTSAMEEIKDKLTMNSEHNKTEVDVGGVTVYDTENLTENGDQQSSNIGEPDPPVLSAEGQNDGVQIEEATETDPSRSAMSKLAITVDDMDIAFLTGSCNFDRQDGVKEERTTVVPQGSYFPGSSDEAVNYISNLSELPLGRSSTPDQDEDGNQKETAPEVPVESDPPGSSDEVPSKLKTDKLLLALSDAPDVPDVPVGSASPGSADEDSETASSDEETDGVPFNYCNIAVPLKIFELYFAIPGSAFNQWIDKLQLKEFTTLKTMLEELNELNAMVSRLEPLMQQLELTTQNTRLKELKEQKEQIRKSAIKFFCGSKTPKDENYYGNTFERLWKFAERNGLLQHQQLYPHCNKSPTPYDIINGMIREKLKEGKCSLTDAVDLVMSGNDIDVPLDRPYWPTKTNPFLAFHLYGVLENSSQLPLTLDYNGILYKLAGVIFHRSDKPSGGNDHYVVRAFDPKQEIWVYNTESDGGWEKDDGDPRTNSEHTFTLSTVVYIIAVPPESIISLSTKAQCIKPPQDI